MVKFTTGNLNHSDRNSSHQSINSTIAIAILNDQSIISTIAIVFLITSCELIPLLKDMASHTVLHFEIIYNLPLYRSIEKWNLFVIPWGGKATGWFVV